MLSTQKTSYTQENLGHVIWFGVQYEIDDGGRAMNTSLNFQFHPKEIQLFLKNALI